MNASRNLLTIVLTLLLTGCAAPSSSPLLERALREKGRLDTPQASQLKPRSLGHASIETVLAGNPLRGADGLACTEGRAFISEAAVDRISEVSPSGGLSAVPFPKSLAGPTHLAVSPGGTLWVSARRSAAIWKRDLSGNWSLMRQGVPNISGLVTAGEDLYFSQCDVRGSISVITPDEPNPRQVATDLPCPGAPAIAGEWLVVPLRESGEVRRIHLRTGATETILRGLNVPSAVRQLPDQNLAVLESGSGILRILDGEGQPLPGEDLGGFGLGISDLAICGKSVLISNRVWGAIDRVQPWPSVPKPLIHGGLLVPQGAAYFGTSLLIADGNSLKSLTNGTLTLLAAVGITPNFPRVAGIVIGQDHAAYLSAPEAGKIIRIGLPSRVATEFASGLLWPTSLARLWTGEIAIAETGSGQILRLTADGQWWPIAYALLSPIALREDRSRILVAEPGGGRILSLRENRAPNSLTSQLASPAGIATDRYGRIFIVERGRGSLAVRGTDGRLQRIVDQLNFGPRPAPYPREIPLLSEPDGAILLISPGDGSILRIRP